MSRLALAAAVAALAAAAGAQPDTTDVRDLGAVEVTASPFALVPGRAPLALAVRQRPAVERATDPAATLDAVGRGLPGLWISDRGNPSTGERVLVRGLGWRAAFGVRGTHVVLDGVPLTLADGQTQLNVIEPALVERVEVVRGPASTFWGSGSAGVLALSTARDPGVRARVLGGAYGLAKAEASAVPQVGDGRRLAVWGSALRQGGFREHSAVRAVRGGLAGSADLGNGQTLGVVALGAVVPRAESPGGITPEQAAEDPRQVRPQSITQDAGKGLAQGHVAVSYARPLGDARLSVVASGAARTLDNPIVPRYITLARLAGGLRATVESLPRTRSGGGRRLAWGVGAEVEGQRDDRLERTNDGGRPGAETLTDQVETVRAGAVFGRLALPVGALTVTAAARADALRYASDVDEARTVGALSPSLGVAYALNAGASAATLYVNAAGALDAPTTTELGNRPDGSPGFNPDLQPERTWGVETGWRAAWAVGGGALGLDAAAFVAWARDLLLPSEIDDVTVYRNAGEARHVGLELAASADGVRAGPGRLTAAAALTLARGVFSDGPAGSEAPAGERVPGFPPRLATWTATWTASGRVPVVLGLDGEAAAAYAADSAGEQTADGYAVVHLRLALAGVALGPGASATPFVTVRNVFDAAYAGSVVVNAFGGRFVEPAPGRHLAAGVTLAIR